eukprot:359550-Chlamydomonas_euryale.AAC.9
MLPVRKRALVAVLASTGGLPPATEARLVLRGAAGAGAGRCRRSAAAGVHACRRPTLRHDAQLVLPMRKRALVAKLAHARLRKVLAETRLAQARVCRGRLPGGD